MRFSLFTLDGRVLNPMDFDERARRSLRLMISENGKR
jgi:hypothetical protein